MITSKKPKPRKIEENKRKSRNIGLEADMLITFKFFFTVLFKMYSECLTAFHNKSSLK